MRTTITRPLLLPLLLCLMVSSRAQDSPVDVVNSRQYVGSYVATQPGVPLTPFSKPLTICTTRKVE